jgi:hypothetical protein
MTSSLCCRFWWHYLTIKDKVTGQAIPNKYVGEYMNGIFKTRRALHFSSAVDKELGDHTVLQRMGISAGNVFTEANPWATDYLQTVFGQNLGIINTKPNTAPSKGEVVFQTVGPIDAETGKVRIVARDDKGTVSAERMRKAMAAQGGGAAPGNSMYGAKDINETTLEITHSCFSRCCNRRPLIKKPSPAFLTTKRRICNRTPARVCKCG